MLLLGSGWGWGVSRGLLGFGKDWTGGTWDLTSGESRAVLGTLLLAPQGLLKSGACTFATPDLFCLCRPGLPLASLLSPPVCLCSSVPAHSCPLLFTLGSALGGACGGSSQVTPLALPM